LERGKQREEIASTAAASAEEGVGKWTAGTPGNDFAEPQPAPGTGLIILSPAEENG